MTPRPIIFVSAVSRELKSARQLVANTLSFLGYEAAWQDIFGTEQGDLRGMLRRQIDGCKGVVQLVGRRYGAEPPAPDEHFGRVSYTQYEALYARQQGKKVWYLVMDESFPVDTQDPEPAELRELQAAYLRRLQADSQLYHPLTTREALETSVLKLRDDLTQLRRGIKQWAAAVIVLLLILVAAVVCITQKLRGINDELGLLVSKGAPPAPTVDETRGPTASSQIRPKLAFDVFGLHQGATNWVPLGPETSLRNGEHFFIRAETFTPGFLYVFQVDSSNNLQWLFPSNNATGNISNISFGTNPLAAGDVALLPPTSSQAYALDTNVGEERTYAVFSATRWEKLEEALKDTSGNTNNAAQLEIKKLLAADDAVEGRAKGIASVENTRVPKPVWQAVDASSERYPVDLPPYNMQAKGYWLLEVRRFRHLAPAQP
jgi:hypothetical protein